MQIKRFLPFLIWIWGLSPFCMAQKAWLQSNKDSVLVGERFELQVAIERNESQKVAFPIPPKSIGDVELFSEMARQVKRENGGSPVEVITFEAAAFGVDSVLVVLPVGVITGKDTLLVQTSPLKLGLKSTVPPKAEGIKDITDLYDFGTDWMFWVYLLGGLVLGLLVLWYIWRKYGPKPKVAAEPIPITPEKTPYQVAMARLQALAGHDLSEYKAQKYFYTEISDLVRMYLETALRIPALETTTRELLQWLQHPKKRLVIAIKPEELATLNAMLEQTDLVKYADFHPDPAAGEALRSAAAEWITILDQRLTATFAAPKPASKPAANDTPKV